MAGTQSAGRKPGRRLNRISVQLVERAPSHRPPACQADEEKLVAGYIAYPNAFVNPLNDSKH
jgi:hypothetical protein